MTPNEKTALIITGFAVAFFLLLTIPGWLASRRDIWWR